uniref:Secreted protein n=1 Tax=Palpitomonas bilix TaxID=652834 RepID=A0A7S3G8T3_9EUKA
MLPLALPPPLLTAITLLTLASFESIDALLEKSEVDWPIASPILRSFQLFQLCPNVMERLWCCGALIDHARLAIFGTVRAESRRGTYVCRRLGRSPLLYSPAASMPFH